MFKSILKCHVRFHGQHLGVVTICCIESNQFSVYPNNTKYEKETTRN